MEFFLSHFAELFTTAGLLALLNIILIDIVMSGDNAILIGMATRNLEGKERKQAIFFGIILATILRIIFAFFAVFLLSVVGLKFAGGLLLLYVVWKFYRELRTHEGHGPHDEVKKAGLMAAIYTIVIADVSMSLDNVLAVAGAAHGNIAGLAIGLVVSIVLMAFASNFIAKYLDKYPQIQWVGLFVILFVAVGMLYEGTHELDQQVFHMNILPFVIFVIGGAMVVLQQKYIRPIDERHIKEWLSSNYLGVIMAGLIIFSLLLFFGSQVSAYIGARPVVLYSLLFIILFIALELVSIMRNKKG